MEYLTNGLIERFSRLYHVVSDGLDYLLNPLPQYSFLGIPSDFFQKRPTGLENIFFSKSHKREGKKGGGHLHRASRITIKKGNGWKDKTVDLKRDRRKGESAKDCLERFGLSEGQIRMILKRHS